tara:strand:- start:623 stop:967 length:345 start_codon:yes stop_codon:yes gene_type:complete
MPSKTNVPLATWQEIEEQYEGHCSEMLYDNESFQPDWDDFEEFVCVQLMKLECCDDDPYDDVVLHYAEYYNKDDTQMLWKRHQFLSNWFQDMLSNWEYDWQVEQAIQHESRCYR